MIFPFRKAGLYKSVAVIVALSLPWAAQAAIYDESVLGDFHGGQLFALVDAHNVFIGSQAWGADTVDGFRFVVQDGHQATINFNYSFSDLSPGEAQARVWDLYRAPAGTGACDPDSAPLGSCQGSMTPGSSLVTAQIFRSAADVGVPSDWEFVDFDQVALGAGTYVLNDNYGFIRFGQGDAATGVFSYSIDIEQAAVPVPAAVWLFGSGLAGLAGLARRRRGH
jgi:hypothetical protein